MAFRDHQDMCRRLWVEVAEGHHVIVFVHLVRRDLAAAILQKGSCPLRRTCLIWKWMQYRSIRPGGAGRRIMRQRAAIDELQFAPRGTRGRYGSMQYRVPRPVHRCNARRLALDVVVVARISSRSERARRGAA